MSSSPKETVCQEADRLTGKDRIEAYGHPKINFDDIARMWTVILRDVLKPGAKVSLTHVGLCNVATKICRHIARPKRDNLVDMAGYANTIAAVEEIEQPEPDWCCGVCGMKNPDQVFACDNGCVEPVSEDPSDIDHSPQSVERAKRVLQDTIAKAQNRPIEVRESQTKQATPSADVFDNLNNTLLNLGDVFGKVFK